MQTRLMTKRSIWSAAAAASMLLAGAAQAALQDRDLDGDAVVDAFYDTDLDITWLRNVSPGRVGNWRQQMTRAAGFSIGGHSDWRLPTSEDCWESGCSGGDVPAHGVRPQPGEAGMRRVLSVPLRTAESGQYR